MISAIVEIGKMVIGGVKGFLERKQRMEEAKVQAKINRLNSAQEHNQKWEILQIENSGWKDDVLFYAFIAMFILAGFYPEKAHEFFQNLSVLPAWFIKTWMWVVASVLGIKKIGDYGPKMIKQIKDAIKDK